MKINDTGPLGLRMPSDIRDWVKSQSKKEHRSMNNFIIHILEKEKALRATNTQSLDCNP